MFTCPKWSLALCTPHLPHDKLVHTTCLFHPFEHSDLWVNVISRLKIFSVFLCAYTQLPRELNEATNIPYYHPSQFILRRPRIIHPIQICCKNCLISIFLIWYLIPLLNKRFLINQYELNLDIKSSLQYQI
jgi:hypothetical protein